jgi:filamentous hemagglutinin family protein
MTVQPLRVAFASRQVRTARRKLLWSCAAAAIVVTAGTGAQKAHAQAFQGTPTLPNPNIAASGSATRNITSPTTETITVATPTATINWIPSDNDGSGTIDFLPAGNVATFTNDPANPDFTVLNRILPSQIRPIALNGTVISQIQSVSGTSTGGHVWFYSPNGIIVGATAVFNVGGLLLTVNDPLTFSATANGFTGNFVASSNSTATVRIDSGAQINATPENSYVAIVAPRVEQAGTVNVNGSAAYVGGEDVTLTMNQGLFDIAVNVGTSDPFNADSGNGVVHTGTTGGPASTGAGDNHRIYMVAVPKNQALTMLLSGNAGFQPASSLNVRNGTIVLAAGSSIAETSGTLNVISPNNINADLTIGSGNYTSDVKAFARGDIDVTADDGFIHFWRDVSLTSLLAGETGIISFGASGGYGLNIEGNVTLQTSGAAFSSGAPEEINLLVNGGTLRIGGGLTIFAGAAADGTPGDVEISVSDQSENHGSLTVILGQTLIGTSAGASTINPDVDSADAFAGDITIEAVNGGSILFQQMVDLFASALGQDNNGNGSGFNLGRAGDGFGGDITIHAAGGGTMTFNNYLHADATGIGGRMLDGGLFGGAGFGGSVELSYFDGGVIHVVGDSSLTARGIGGRFIGTGTPGSAQGGTGFGGFVRISGSGTGFDPGSITIDSGTTLAADGTGGSGQTGGAGFGGSAGISATDGTIALGSTISVSARGTGGGANFGFGGSGGAGFGGYAFINALAIPPGVEQFATAGTITGGDATIDATGTGGSGGAGNGDNILAGAGGTGFGGEQCQGDCSDGGASAVASVDGGSLTLGNVTLLANGVGGTGGAGGNDQAGGAGGQGFGGGIVVGLIDNPFFSTGAAAGEAHYGNIFGFASGNGGNGGAGGSSVSGPLPNGDGGTGWGGTASLWSNSLVTASSVTFFANGNGGDGGNGGSAFGGFSSIISNDAFIFIDDILTRVDGSVDITGDVTLEAAAASGNGSSGTTGDASGGTAELFADGGDVSIGGDVFVGADGDAEDGVTGGFGQGGLARVQAGDGADLSAASLTVQALGEGGNGTLSAGSGDGGTAEVLAHGGASITTGAITANASGLGGNSIDGGTGFGGVAEAAALEQDSTLTVTGLVTLRANGTGGTGTAAGVGGTGYGGAAKLYAGVGESVTGGATVTIANAEVYARGLGGVGGTGGIGVGGGDLAESEGVLIGARLGTLTFTGTLFADAGGVGGAGLNGVGGDGFGGNILVGANFLDDVGLATLNLGAADLWAVGVGGNGGGSGNAGGDGTGGEVVVTTPTAGSVMTATALSLHAGANGGVGGNGATGGRGGDAIGGHALIDIASGSANLGAVSSFVRGVAGNGGTGSSGAGGDGGNGFAGFAELNVSGTLTGASYQGHAQANGGVGGAGTTQGAGGLADGGTAAVNIFSGGEATFTGGVSVSSSATGGNGSTGGNATGGSANLFVDGGTLTVTGLSAAAADAQGGNGTTQAGSGNGGSAFVLATGGGEGNLGTLTTVSANGTGGSATVGGQGSGNGGSARLSVTAGSSITGVDATVTANGRGGNGVSGGDAQGGAPFGEGSGGAYIEASGVGATLTLTGTATATANAVGGNATTGDRGDGDGGLASVGAFDGAVVTLGAVSVQSNGVGGAGSTPDSGTGGTAILTAQGGTITAGSATVLANGSAEGDTVEISSESYFGSGSGQLTLGALTAAANGALAGEILVTVADGSTADLGIAQLSALGQSGGLITIDIGDAPLLAFGGIGTFGLNNIVLTADSLALNTSGDIDIVSHNGASIDVAGIFLASAAGAMTLDDVDGTAVVRADIIDFDANSFSSTFDILGRVIDIFSVLDLDVTSTVLLAEETLTLSSNNDVIAGDLSAGVAINLFAGGDILAGDLDSGGTMDVSADGDVTLGDLTAVGEVDLESGGNPGSSGNLVFGDANVGSLDFEADGSVTGGNILAVNHVGGDAGGAVNLGNITVTGPEPVDDFSIGIAAATSINVGNVSGTDRVGFATLGDLTTGNITAGSLFMALVGDDITTGSITTAPNGRVYMADAQMFLDAGGTDDFDESLVLPLAPVPTGGSITIAGSVSTGRFQAAAGDNLQTANITAASSIEASAGDNISTGNLLAGTTAGLTAGNNLTTGNIGFGQSVTLNAGNDISAADLTGGQNVSFTAGNNLAVGDVDAAGTATFTAVGVASFLGEVAVPTITVTSSDINIPFGGSLGMWGITDLVTLNAVSGNPIIIGSTGGFAAAAASANYVLDEDGDITADTVVINAVGAGNGADPNIIVHNVEIEGSLAADPHVHHVIVNTDASVLVDGLVLFTGAAGTDSLAINAGDSIQVNTTAGGRIALTNVAEDRPSGVLTLTSDHIWVGSQSLLDQLNANINFAGRDALVGTNAGVEVPEGYLIADGMTLTVAGSLFVQNSGIAKNYAGITVGAGGLDIVTTGTAPAQVVAYGRKMNSDGTFVGGNQFFALVDFNKATSLYTAQSEFNECLINTGCSLGGGIGGGTLGPESILGPVDLMGNPEETIEWAENDDSGQPGGDDGSGSDWSSQLFDTAGLSDDALVDEGVTSGGDNNQWDSQVCTPTEPGQPCPETAPPTDKQEQ